MDQVVKTPILTCLACGGASSFANWTIREAAGATTTCVRCGTLLKMLRVDDTHLEGKAVEA